MKTYLPEFFNRFKRFFNVKDADQQISENVTHVQPVMAQIYGQDLTADPALHALTVNDPTSPNLRVQLFNSISEIQDVAPADGVASLRGLVVGCYRFVWNGVTWDLVRSANVDGKTASAGASALTILAAAGALTFNRIHSIVLSTNNAGLVVLSDGLPSIQLPANGSIEVHFPQGWKQDTADTAITATLAGATLAAGVTFNTEA